MHPLFKSRNGLLSYLIAWVPLGAMLGFVLGVYGHLRPFETVSLTIPITCLLAVLCLSPWYTCRSLPLNGTPPLKILLNHIVAAMFISAIVLALVPFMVGLESRVSPTLAERFHFAMPVLAGMVFLCYLLSIALHYVGLAVESGKQAEILSREAELKALKAQVNPHFLFNSLNSISALTSVDAKRAREMCIRLSDFLRISLRLGEKLSIPFGEELSLTGSYLDVEQIRFGARLRVHNDFDPASSDCEVPPLLVQPLVENAIKHGIASLTDGGEILMSARVTNERLRFTIENPFDPDAPAMRKSGFGLVNVRSRLAARYGAAARLEIQVENNVYKVVMTLPCGRTR
jgi:two-component system sensor histidine kinase AlgZ